MTIAQPRRKHPGPGRKHLVRRCGLLLLLMAHSSANAEYPTPAASPEELETRIQNILDDSGTPGMIGAIVYDNDVVWQGALGVADGDTHRPVAHDTPFRVGSISKMFVSLAILKLVERGKLRLTDTIDSLAPEAGVISPWAETDPVRLVHLLEHTAGLVDVSMRAYVLKEPPATTRRGIELSATAPMVRWRPGTRMAYSNLGPPIAALALENVADQTFEEIVDREIFAPLGMKTATYFYDDDVASGYNEEGRRTSYSYIVRPGGAASASSSDMIQLLKMFNNRGAVDNATLIQPASLRRMETPTSTLAARAGLRVGYGLGNYTMQKNGFVFQGHGGGIDGFTSRLAYLPHFGRGYFISINAHHVAAFYAIDDEITAFVTKDLDSPEQAPLVNVPEEQLRAFEGTYLPDTINAQLGAGFARLNINTVMYKDGNLYLGALLSTKTELKPAGHQQFVVGNNPLPSYIFLKSPEGEQLVQTGDTTLRRVSPMIAYTPLAILVASAFIWLTTLLFAPVWVGRKLLGRLQGVRYLSLRVFPLVAIVPLFLGFFLIASPPVGVHELARPTVWSVGVWICSLLFPCLAGLSLFNTLLRFPRRREAGLIVWYHSLLASIANVMIAAFLGGAGLIGLRTWAF